ncbi:arginase [Wenyingzhuangia sp. 2_MG-2023]|uniref:arginase n=1 Tax=Wenyingzhuangia sp. 2_MG-2023 TaxID=3062639 RepID=UPI0026E2724B|nr:arginase [Wenyingzhuangia sp. 2_MG-2023]MDO6738558.1 arginase [Wenyingzhuangia sp. 2_MG-2023]MDO6803219.1 arginase [Wenyingzhuangia sp. 1_MG-2023]
MKNNINLIYNRSEIGAGTRGSSIGIDALLMEATKKGSTFFRDTPSQAINDKNHILTVPSNHKWAKHIDGLIGIYEEVCDTVCQVLQKENFPLIISGDHASSGGSVAGIKKAFPEKRLGLIWIDAHADLHSPYTSPSGNVHGMPIATIINEDNLKFELDDVDESTKIEWEKLKNVGGVKPKALPTDIVFIGVRDTEKEEDYLIEKHGIVNFTPEILREKGVEATLLEIKEELLADCDIVYVSFDVDSLDSNIVSTGTGTPVENGLFVEEVKKILKAFLSWNKVIALEVTEINPLLDNKGNKMAETALEILEFALNS